MLWQLLWLALGGLLIGSLGRLAVRGPAPWPRTLGLGLAGALGAGLPAEVVVGRDHRLIAFAVAAVLTALPVLGYAAYRRVRALPPA